MSFPELLHVLPVRGRAFRHLMNWVPNWLRFLSLRRLWVMGFGFTILPLALAFLSVFFAVSELAELSRATVDHVAQESHQSRLLQELLIDVERKGRQYLVFEDQAAREAYVVSHEKFVETATELSTSFVPQPADRMLSALIDEEGALYRSLIEPRPTFPEKIAKGRPRVPSSDPIAQENKKRAAEAFQNLHAKVFAISQGYSDHVDQEAEGLRTRLLGVQDRLLRQSVILVPVGLGILSCLLFLTLRPMRQMDQAIRTLGRGEFSKAIVIKGPRDLQYLGTRLEWLRTRLIELEEGKHRFLRNVSHEIKTPLANLHEGVELLADEVVGELNPEQREIARIVLGNVDKLEGLIGELIQFGRVNARTNVRPPEEVDVGQIIEGLIEDYQLQLRNKDLKVRSALRNVTVLGNGEQLRTVFDNLLSNAVKYSPQGGRIDINLCTSGNMMELEIEDDGPGISEDERDLIFEPFFQGHSARKLGVKGSGFGLAIAAECVAAHRGALTVLDPREGRSGARIRVQIPIRPDTA